jgi:Protein kinase domain/SMP-30/Gluconolactonase/LRE-like region/NHL repeat
MSEDASRPAGAGSLPPVSSFTGPIAELVGHGLLSPPSRPGLLATLDGYEVLRVLGAGGMGVVVLARDGRSGKQVAIKMVRPELLADGQIVHRFLKEAGHLQRLRHANVIEVLEVKDREQGPYFVMPYFEEGNLARRIRPGRTIESQVILSIASEICEALQFAHRRGIIHRDLKPANILLTADGKACLADFGLARTLFNDTIIEVDKQECEGTAPYMSPGTAAGNAEDTRCDIYAFGALLYEMLTGEPPYKGRTTREVRDLILAGPPRAIKAVNPDADAQLAMVAEGAMGRELRDRYADIADVLADLRRIREGKAPVGPHGAVRSLRDNLQRARRLPVLVGVPVCMVALAMAGWLLWRSEKPRTAKAPPVRVATNTVSRNAGAPVPVGVAEFQVPWGVAVDDSGIVYVADSEACTITRISGSGQVSTVAGRAGLRGPTNGLGANARFIIPRGIALDKAGNLYITDAYTIRKLAAGTGEVTTLAGQHGYPATTDGLGSEARFSWPSAVAVDRAGDLYVADRYAIRQITPDGKVTTLAGAAGHAGSADGVGADARFSDNEKGIAVDGAGNIYVADTLNHMIRKLTPDGVVTTLAGSLVAGSADGPGTSAGFAKPCGLAVDAKGVLYVADAGNHTIRKITPDGAVSTLAGTAGVAGSADGPCSRALFNQPRGLAVDGAGNVFVADSGNRSIRKITPAGLVSTVAARSAPLALNR